jgi:uncharacterized protein YbaA (DUF1428 family)
LEVKTAGDNMFASVYIYRVPRESVQAFLRVQRQAAKITRQYGALDDETWGPVDLAAKYGCSAFGDSLTVAQGEDVFLGLSRFRDEAHHDEVMQQIDSDPRINELYDELTGLLDVRRVVRGEFERVV